MKTIWKFSLDLVDRQVIDMPHGAQVLTVQKQSHALCLWAVVDTTAEREGRIFEIHGTGNPMSEIDIKRLYVATVQQLPFVWHVFERTQ